MKKKWNKFWNFVLPNKLVAYLNRRKIQKTIRRNSGMKEKLKLAAPWTTYYREMKALFGDDKQIKVIFDEDDAAIKLYVDNAAKAEALTKMLPIEKTFGNVKVAISVIPANGLAATEDAFNIANAFANNPILDHVTDIDGVLGFSITYISFVNKVVQFFNDDLSDEFGFKSTLYEDIARDIFGDVNGVAFCTAPEKKLGKPLGEWP